MRRCEIARAALLWRRVSLGVAAVSLGVASGCSYAAVEAQAASDLRCPDVSVVSMGKIFVAQGCGRTGFYGKRGGYVLQARRPAAQALACEPAQVELLVKEDTSSALYASGCGRHVLLAWEGELWRSNMHSRVGNPVLPSVRDAQARYRHASATCDGDGLVSAWATLDDMHHRKEIRLRHNPRSRLPALVSTLARCGDWQNALGVLHSLEREDMVALIEAMPQYGAQPYELGKAAARGLRVVESAVEDRVYRPEPVWRAFALLQVLHERKYLTCVDIAPEAPGDTEEMHTVRLALRAFASDSQPGDSSCVAPEANALRPLLASDSDSVVRWACRVLARVGTHRDAHLAWHATDHRSSEATIDACNRAHRILRLRED